MGSPLRAGIEKTANQIAGERRFWVVFAFFSNRLGCIGSIVVSVLGSLLLLLIVRGCGAAL